MAIVDIIGFRHGETDENLSNIMQGCSINNVLNPTGKKQAIQLAEKLVPLVAEYDGIWMISSDLLRAKDTGLMVYQKLPQQKTRGFKETTNLRERNYGSFEGKDKHLIRKTAASKAYWELKTVNERLKIVLADDVETDHALITRARLAINTVIQAQKDNVDREILLVSSHGNTLRTLLTAIFNDANYPPLNNCEYVKFSVDQWNQMIWEK